LSSTIASLVANVSVNTAQAEAGLANFKGNLQKTAAEAGKMAGVVGNVDPYKNAAAEMAKLNQQHKDGDFWTKANAASQSALYSALSKTNPQLIEGARAAKLNTTQTFAMAQATGLYKESQLAAAVSSEILTKKSHQLADSVAKGKMTAEQAGQTYRKYYDEQQAMIKGSMTFGEKMTANFQNMKNVVGAGLMVAGAAYAGARAVGAAYEFAGEGAQLSRMQDSYTTLANQQGYDPSQLLRSLQTVSHNTVAANDLMLTSNQAMFLGVGQNTQQLANLMEVASFRGRAMGLNTTQAFSDIARGVGRMSPLILDNLGIVIDAKRRYEEFAEATGVSVNSLDKAQKRQILLNSVLEEGNRQIVLAGGLSNDTAASYERMGASWENFTNGLKMSQATAFEPANNFFAKRLDDWTKFNALQERAENVFQLQTGRRSGIADATAVQRIAQQIEQRDLARQSGISPTISQQMGQLDTASRGYLMQAAGVGMTAEGAVDPEVEARRTATLLEGAVNITQQTEQYTRVTSELNAELAKESEELEKISRRYGENSEKTAKQAEKVQAVKDKLTEVGAAATQSGQAMLMSTIQNMGATDQQSLEFARASGLISEQAFVQQNALNQIAEAYNAGSISAAEAANAGQKAMNMVSGINGMYSSATIDIFINYIISSGRSAGSNNVTQTMVGNSLIMQGGGGGNQITERRAVGGPVIAGGMYHVTEGGAPEILNAGGQQFLMMGNQGGYVSPLRGEGAARASGSDAAMMEMIARMPSDTGIAKALARELDKRGW
jgi:hypothetical protein